jgi:serine/threonine protein kinase
MSGESTGIARSRFELVAPLGEGGSGVVYRAIDRDSGETVAVKTLRLRSAEAIALLRNEFRVVQGMRHPNLLEIRDLVLERGEWLLSMECLDGEDLLRHVRKGAPGATASFDEARVRKAFADLGAALDALHRGGRVHRDIKPSNVMVTREGRLVVLDFGLARGERGIDGHGDESVAGTVRYMRRSRSRARTSDPRRTGTRSAPCCSKRSPGGRRSKGPTPRCWTPS